MSGAAVDKRCTFLNRVSRQFKVIRIVLAFSAMLIVRPAPLAIADELRVPAYTAYVLPNPDGARISERRGVTRWTDPNQTINWYGKFKSPGRITAKITLHLHRQAASRFKLSIGDQSREVIVQPLEVKSAEDDFRTVDFGGFEIAGTGYQRICLQFLEPQAEAMADIDALILDGPGIVDAHFNTKTRRNAASVHLFYTVPEKTDIAGFYCEVTAIEDPVASFYMACGWHRGYFGMQVNSSTERRIIFSVWDSGNEGVDRNKVKEENRVKLIRKGEGVYTGDFGNEGTGGHSHLKTSWKTGEKQRFFVTAEPTSTRPEDPAASKTHTTFTGYWFQPERKEWLLISAWTAPKEGGYLKRLHSFSENFGGANGHLLRKANYGNQWIRNPDGHWHELTTASFSHDPTGRNDRFDRFMGVVNGEFFLSHGGFTDDYSKFGDLFTRPPMSLEPAIPEVAPKD